MIYLVKVCINLAVFYLFYKVMFARLVFFKANRVYLLSTIFLSFLVPLLYLPESAGATRFSYSAGEFIFNSVNSDHIGLRWDYAIRVLYFGVLAILVLLSVKRFFEVFSTKYPTIKVEGFILHLIPDEKSSYSFFMHLFIPEKEFTLHSMILNHEKVHAKQGHSFDVVLMELVRDILWFFPLTSYIRKELRQVHEYLADDEVCKRSDVEAYCDLLVHASLNVSTPAYTNSFYQPILKNRIMMITKNKNLHANGWRYAFILPILVITLMLTANSGKVFAQQDGRIFRPGHLAHPDHPDMPEKMPEYNGGDEARGKFMSENMHYPENARKAKIEGKVVIRFVVSSTGKVTDFEFVKSSGNEEMDNEAIRVVKLMPDWIPASDKGKNVACEFLLPVSFRLN